MAGNRKMECAGAASEVDRRVNSRMLPRSLLAVGVHRHERQSRQAEGEDKAINLGRALFQREQIVVPNSICMGPNELPTRRARSHGDPSRRMTFLRVESVLLLLDKTERRSLRYPAISLRQAWAHPHL